MKHKSPDYKLSAVNYYLNHEDGYDNTCKIFDCKKSSLKDGYINIKLLKILQEKTENLYLIKLLNHK
jgi:hypothetical protein